MIGWMRQFVSIITARVKNIINDEIEQMDRYYRQQA